MTGTLWATSQGCALRRIHFAKNLGLYQYMPPYSEAGYASGGFMANCRVEGNVTGGSQQQYFTRSCEMNGFQGNVWNFVFVGNTAKGIDSHCSNAGGRPYVTVNQTPLIAEKPFISIDANGKYSISVPALRTDSTGVDWDLPLERSVPFENVFVANASSTAADINANLAKGLDVVLTPGVYDLEEVCACVCRMCMLCFAFCVTTL